MWYNEAQTQELDAFTLRKAHNADVETEPLTYRVLGRDNAQLGLATCDCESG